MSPSAPLRSSSAACIGSASGNDSSISLIGDASNAPASDRLPARNACSRMLAVTPGQSRASVSISRARVAAKTSSGLGKRASGELATA